MSVYNSKVAKLQVVIDCATAATEQVGVSLVDAYDSVAVTSSRLQPHWCSRVNRLESERVRSEQDEMDIVLANMIVRPTLQQAIRAFMEPSVVWFYLGQFSSGDRGTPIKMWRIDPWKWALENALGQSRARERGMFIGPGGENLMNIRVPHD